jgi:hypothetical protein
MESRALLLRDWYMMVVGLMLAFIAVLLPLAFDGEMDE